MQVGDTEAQEDNELNQVIQETKYLWLSPICDD